MANNDIFLKFGLDPGSFDKLIAEFSTKLRDGIEKSLKGFNVGKEIVQVSPDQIASISRDLKLAVAQARLSQLVGQEIAIGAADGAKSITAAIRDATAKARIADAASSSANTPAGAMKDLQAFPGIAKQLTTYLPDVEQRFASLYRTINNPYQSNTPANILKDLQHFPALAKEITSALPDVEARFTSLSKAINSVDAKRLVNGTKAPVATPALDALPDLDRSFNQQSLDNARVSIDRLQASLRAEGATAKEAAHSTQELTRQLIQIAKAYDNISIARQARGARGESTEPTEKEAQRLFLLEQRFKNLTSGIKSYSVEQEKANAIAKRGSDFMESFGFKVGILGFSLGILGGHLQRLTQNMVQFITSSAKATEPLERIQNLVTQLVESGEIAGDQKDTIFAEINRLADLPGSSLDAVTAGFRKLLVVTEDVGTSLKLVEQLTKATGRSGTGERGLGQLVFQLAQFAESKKLDTRDIKSIKEQGGSDIAKIITKLGGETGIEALGSKKFFNELITGLEKVPAPLEAAQDKLNKINNSLTRMRLNVLEILKPGLDDLLVTFHALEGVVESLRKRFASLSPETQKLFSTALLGVVGFAGALSVLLTVLAAVGIALAGGKHLLDSLGIASGSLSTRLKDLRVMLGSVITGGLGRLAAVVTAPLAGIRALATELTVLGSKSLATGLIFGKATRDWSAVLRTLFLGGEYVVGFGVKFRGLMGIMSAGLSGLTGGVLRVLGLTNPIGILINLVIAFITDFGRFRSTIVSGLDDMYQSVTRLIGVLSEASEKGRGLGVVFNFLAGLFQTVVAIVEAFVGVLGSLVSQGLGGLANVIDLVSNLIDAFNEDNWTATFSKIGDAFLIFFARIGQITKALILDLEISFAQAGVRMFSYLPKSVQTAALGSGGVDTLKSTVAGLIEQRTAMDGLTYSVDKTTGKVVAFNKEQKNAQAEIRKTAITTDEWKESMARMSEQVKALTLDLSKQQAGINGIGSAWEDAANKLRTARIEFQAQLSNTQDTREFNDLIKRDIDAAEAQLNSFLGRMQVRNEEAARSSVQAALSNATTNSTQAIEAINKATLGAGKVDKKTGQRTDIAGIVSQVYPAANAALTDLQTKLVAVNARAKSGVNDFRAFNIQLNEVTSAAQAAGNSMNQIAPGAYDSTQVNEAKAAVQGAIDASIANIQSLQAASTASATAMQNAELETKKLKDERLEEIRLRRLAIRTEEEIQPIRAEIVELNAQLIAQQELLSEAQDTENIGRQKYILTQIEGIKTSILGKENLIADKQNYQNDQLTQAQNTNEHALKTMEAKVDAQQTLNNLLRDNYKANVALFTEAIDNADALIEKYRTIRELAGTDAEGFIAPDFRDSNSTQQAGTIEKLKRQASEISKTVHTTVSTEGRAVNFDATTVKKQFKDLIDSLYLYSEGVFEDSFERVSQYYGKLSATLVERLNSTQDNIDQAEIDLRDNKALDDKQREKLAEHLNEQKDIRAEIANQIKDVAKVEGFLNNLFDQRTKNLDRELKTRTASLTVSIKELEVQERLIEARSSLEKSKADNQEAKAHIPGALGTLAEVLSESDRARNVNLEYQLKLLKIRHDMEIKNLEVQKIGLKIAQARHAPDSEEYKAIQAQIAIIDEYIAISKEQYEVERSTIELEKERTKTTASKLDRIKKGLDQIHQAGREAKDSILGLFDALANGEYVVDAFADVIANGGSVLEAFKELATSAFAALGKAVADAIVDTIVNGGNFIANLGKMFGQLLIMIGTQLIQLGAAAVIIGLLAKVPFFSFLDPTGISIPAGIAVAAIGTGMVALGAAMGGGGAAKETANKNAGNSANSQTGATGEGFDPNKDPKTAFQKALSAEILIDIRTDDTQIVKTIVKHVNGNGRLATLIGNRKLQFGY